MTQINLITPPDKLYNNSPSLLLINPSEDLKDEVNTVLGNLTIDSLNLYLFEESQGHNQEWLLDIINTVNYIVLDIDHCYDTNWLIGYVLHFDKTYWLTKKQDTVYNTINVNKVYDLDFLLDKLTNGDTFETKE